MSQTDILTSVYDFIFEHYMTKGAHIFKKANIRSLTSDDVVMRDGTTTNDYPELAMVPRRLIGPQFASSSQYKVDVLYDVLLSSGKMNVRSLNMVLSWYLEKTCDMDTLKGIFQWEGYRPIENVTFVDANIGLTNDVRSVKGFSSLGALQIKLKVPRTFKGTVQ